MIELLNQDTTVEVLYESLSQTLELVAPGPQGPAGGGGGGTPGGSDTEVQFNNAGAFGGVSDAKYTPGDPLGTLTLISDSVIFSPASNPEVVLQFDLSNEESATVFVYANSSFVRTGTGSVENYVIGFDVDGTPVTAENIFDNIGGDLTSQQKAITQNPQNANYTLQTSDVGKHIFHDSATPHTFTIPSNVGDPIVIGGAITIVNNTGAGNITLAITSDTLRRGDGTAGTGSRTIGPDSIATIIKTKTTEWMITGAFT